MYCLFKAQVPSNLPLNPLNGSKIQEYSFRYFSTKCLARLGLNIETLGAILHIVKPSAIF